MSPNRDKKYSTTLRRDKYFTGVLRGVGSLLLLGGTLLISALVFQGLRLLFFGELNHSF